MPNKIPRVKVREQDPQVRATNFSEVCLGYNRDEALLEASRCLNCKRPRCVDACPVHIDIPGFIHALITDGEAEAARIIAKDSSLPSVCGRVCPQETQCEGSCVLGIKSEPVAIGKLERYVGDWKIAHMEGRLPSRPEPSESVGTHGSCVRVPANIVGTHGSCVRPSSADSAAGLSSGENTAPCADTAEGRYCEADTAPRANTPPAPKRHKVAIIGSGPAGLACASDLARLGYQVKVFEALHQLGGVLVYGIPEFRLPKEKIVAAEIDAVRRLGVEFVTDVVVGRTTTIDHLLDEEGFDAVFVGSGAGLPRFMGIPGENLNGVFSANEYLTRVNLMHAYDDRYDTPVFQAKRVVVVGGGNVAMDAVRTAKRLGAESIIVYRRSEAELPARVEEVHHAKEEGIEFRMLTNPVRVLGDDKGWVRGIECVEMELGEPDASGRRSPIEKVGSNFEIECDAVIMALGTSPNPLIKSTTKGLDTNRRGCLVADEDGRTTRPRVFAGGDAVTGAATVILAMGAGRRAAKAIHSMINDQLSMIN